MLGQQTTLIQLVLSSGSRLSPTFVTARFGFLLDSVVYCVQVGCFPVRNQFIFPDVCPILQHTGRLIDKFTQGGVLIEEFTNVVPGIASQIDIKSS